MKYEKSLRKLLNRIWSSNKQQTAINEWHRTNYVFGQDSSANSHFWFPSGIDMLIYIDGEQYGFGQAISWDVSSEGTSGTLTSLILDKMLPLDLGSSLKVSAVSEFGKSITLLDLKSVKWESLTTGISVDDIVMEATHSFTEIKEDKEA